MITEDAGRIGRLERIVKLGWDGVETLLEGFEGAVAGCEDELARRWVCFCFQLFLPLPSPSTSLSFLFLSLLPFLSFSLVGARVLTYSLSSPPLRYWNHVAFQCVCRAAGVEELQRLRFQDEAPDSLMRSFAAMDLFVLPAERRGDIEEVSY